MTEKLEPCPFCGGEAARITLGVDDGPENIGGDVITCTRCQASSRVEFGRKENLVSAWNTRPASSHGPILEALEEARVGLQAMMDAWFDYHDAHSLTQPVTGAAGNAFDMALAARDTIDSALAKGRAS